MRPWLPALILSLPVGLAAQVQDPPPRPDPQLQRVVEQAVQGFIGHVGVYVRHLPSGRSAALNADTLFPTASMIKVPIAIAVFDALARGDLAWDQRLIYTDSLLYEGDDLLGLVRDSSAVPLNQLLLLSLTMSDNTASLWLQHLAGTGVAINAWLEGHGFQATRMNSRTPGREAAREEYGWGQTTPREMAELFRLIRRGKVVSPAASQQLYRALTRSYWNGEALSQIPPWVQAASKQGAVNQSRSETVLVNAPSGDYVFSVITKDQADETWGYDNAGYALLRRVSSALWRYFEPGHPWTPAPGAENWVP